MKTIKQQLLDEGFKNVYEWRDEPGTDYAAHQHKDKVSLYIVDGGLSLFIDNKTVELKRGDRFDVPPGKQHTAKVGKEGCVYVVGEMIEGDS